MDSAHIKAFLILIISEKGGGEVGNELIPGGSADIHAYVSPTGRANVMKVDPSNGDPFTAVQYPSTGTIVVTKSSKQAKR